MRSMKNNLPWTWIYLWILSLIRFSTDTHYLMGRFTFERIHDTKEQIYFYKRAKNHKAKDRLFESFKNEQIFQVNILMRGRIKDSWNIKDVSFLVDFISFILDIHWKWNNWSHWDPNYFIFIEYLIAGEVRQTTWTPRGFATVMRSKSPIKDWTMLAITGNTTKLILIY